MSNHAIMWAGILSGVVAAYACKVPPYDHGDSGLNFNLKGVITIIFCTFDVVYASPQYFEELVGASVGSCIGYVLFFYIIYGVMSLLKVSGENVEERRTNAFWINAIISTALCFWAYG